MSLPEGPVTEIDALRPREDRAPAAPLLPGWSDQGLRNAIYRQGYSLAGPSYQTVVSVACPRREQVDVEAELEPRTQRLQR